MKRIMTKVSVKRRLVAWITLLAAVSLLAAPGVLADQQPTYPVSVAVVVPDEAGNHEFLYGGLVALFHASENNVWLNFNQNQPEEVSLSGVGRVQFVNGNVQANGIVNITLAPESALLIDLGQLDGDDDNPFEIGPGGGCLVNLTGLLTTPENSEGILIPVHFAFSAPDS